MVASPRSEGIGTVRYPQIMPRDEELLAKLLELNLQQAGEQT